MKRITLLYILSLAFTGCNKNVAELEKPYLRIPDEVWSYIKLDPGSWYIYKDSASGATDSVNVTVSTIHYKSNRNPAGYYDDYTLTLEKVTTAGNRIAWLTGESGAVINPPALSIPNYWQFIDRIGDVPLLQYPSTPINLSYPYIFHISNLSSSTIEGQTYNDIQVCYGYYNSFEEIWWVKGVGIVKLSRGNGAFAKTAFLLRKK